MLDSILDGLIDTLKLLPYLFVTFLLLEFIEHKMSKRSEKILTNNKKYGPFLGGILGALPQCGFSAMAAQMFSNRVITIGTLVAVFLSTSDEMLPIMLSYHADILVILRIIGFKLLIGIIVGIIVDIFIKDNKDKIQSHISDMCHDEHCSCHKDGVFISSIKHAIKIGLFILIANIFINSIIYLIGEDNVSNLLLNKNFFTYFLASLIGLIPNCASSVIITDLYLSKYITIGHLFSGLLPGSGLGILLLFKTNKNIKENIYILSIIYIVDVFVGMIIDFVL